MRVDWVMTNKKCVGDRKFFFTTREKEPITMFKVFEMLNLLAHNEWKIHSKYPRFFFEEATQEVIEQGKKGISWDDPKNKLIIEEFCMKYKINLERSELNDIHQTTLGDFK